MTTIRQTIDIPPDRRVRIELAIPEDVPAGKAEMAITIAPAEKTLSRKTLAALAGAWADSGAFDRDGVTIQREMRG